MVVLNSVASLGLPNSDSADKTQFYVFIYSDLRPLWQSGICHPDPHP